jgi:hypothetical protein
MIPELPEGAKIVGYNFPTGEQFSLDGVFIRQGRSNQAGYILEAADGYTFQYQIATDAFVPVRLLLKRKDLTFAEAISAVQSGKMVARGSWDYGKVLCIVKGNLPYLSVKILDTDTVERYRMDFSDYATEDWFIAGDAN